MAGVCHRGSTDDGVDMKAVITIEVDEFGEVVMYSHGDGYALVLANEMIEMVINGELDDFVGTDIQRVQ